MDADFPAAHSMDTSFFAVDKDGHVAHFSTGEAGAAPMEAGLEDPDAALREIARLVPAGEVVYDLEGRLLPGPLNGGRGNHALHMAGHGSLLMFLDTLDPVADEV